MFLLTLVVEVVKLDDNLFLFIVEVVSLFAAVDLLVDLVDFLVAGFDGLVIMDGVIVITS